MFFWVEEAQINTNELKKGLVVKDNYGHTLWYRAVEKCNLHALEALWSWAK